ncbi:MAG: hypothetical protein IPM63_11455 [Acidobacteriota bacterium]|nr:MAG: hypothetical protein IPM63_11455 [Acidobacteriota bacterium]
MKTLLIISMFIAVFGANRAQAQQLQLLTVPHPESSSYPAVEYKGRIGPPRIKGEARMFRSGIIRTAEDPPNFAGHYRITTWGCGAGCVMGTLVNVITGHVMFLPATISDWPSGSSPLEFRKNSRLLVINGVRNENEVETSGLRHFYEISGKKFLYIGSAKREEKIPVVR